MVRVPRLGDKLGGLVIMVGYDVVDGVVAEVFGDGVTDEVAEVGGVLEVTVLVKLFWG